MSFQKKAAELIKDHKHVISFTGAGISTPSGIPDFRSPDTGLWNLIAPKEIPTLSRFKANPETFYKSFKPLMAKILKSKPNPAHFALAELERMGKLRSIITQNIDMLHQKARSKVVIELHGTLKTATCLQCYQQIKSLEVFGDYLKDNLIPVCSNCGSSLKPDIVLFEEQLPYQAWQDAQSEIRKCDLLLVIGTSLETFPAAQIPFEAINLGAKVIMINKAETSIDQDVDLLFNGDASTILPKILRFLSSEFL